MEIGILKRLPEVWWQHKIDSVSLLVEFTEPGFFEYIYKSPPTNLGSTSFAFSGPVFQPKCSRSRSKKDKMPLSLFHDQP